MALNITTAGGKYGAKFTPQAYGKSQTTILTGMIDFDSSYPTGGEVMDLSEYFTFLGGVIFESKSGYIFEYDYQNGKVKAMYFDNDGAADGAAVEVANTTDLSALTDVRFIAWGY